ncbi:MAG TPA: ArsC/Spx/MgsR family protein [Candidatus Acidoferrales bacterium]
MPKKKTPKAAARKAPKRPTKPKSAARSKSRGPVDFWQKPNCTSCRNARAYLETCGFDLRLRDIGKDRLKPAEIETLIGDQDHTKFLNTRNELYRTRKMKQNPPTRAETIKLIAAEPNLIRRPIIMAQGKLILGFDQPSIDTL